MANYLQLKAAIDQVIKANGQKEITGPVLNDTLKAIVNSLGAGYQFRGVATPSTNPGTPDQNVFYIAGQGGTYVNFNSIVLPDGVSILKWNGSWSSETILAGDGVFDISAYKATGGTLATFADLSAALDGGNNIPSALRKGGMSVKFVQSSDNNYVQARCMADSFTTDTTQWQGVDDEPTAGSKNLIESGCVSGQISMIKDGKLENTVNTVANTYYLNRLYYSFKNGDEIKLSCTGSSSLIGTYLIIRDSNGIEYGSLYVNTNKTITFSNNASYIEVIRDKVQVIGSGPLTFTIEILNKTFEHLNLLTSKVNTLIPQVSDLSKYYRTIALKGGSSASIYKAYLVAGNHYKVYIPKTTWGVSSITDSSLAILAIDKYYNNSNVGNVFMHRKSGGFPVVSVIDITAESNVDWYQFTLRGDVGEDFYLAIEDITEIQRVSDDLDKIDGYKKEFNDTLETGTGWYSKYFDFDIPANTEFTFLVSSPSAVLTADFMCVLYNNTTQVQGLTGNNINIEKKFTSVGAGNRINVMISKAKVTTGGDLTISVAYNNKIVQLFDLANEALQRIDFRSDWENYALKDNGEIFFKSSKEAATPVFSCQGKTLKMKIAAGITIRLFAYDKSKAFVRKESISPSTFEKVCFYTIQEPNIKIQLMSANDILVNNISQYFECELLEADCNKDFIIDNTIVNRSVAISDTWKYLSGDGSFLGIDEATGICYALYNTGTQGYGESKELLILSAFPINNPYDRKDYEVLKINTQYGDYNFSFFQDANMLVLDDVVRVFFDGRKTGETDKTWYYIDFDKTTHQVSLPTPVKFIVPGGSTELELNRVNYVQYQSDNGYTYDEFVYPTMSANFAEYNSKLWTIITTQRPSLASPTNPVVGYTEDNGATIQFVNIVPIGCDCEAQIAFADDVMYLEFRQSASGTQYGLVISDDEGATFTGVDYYRIGTTRPQMRNIGDKVLIASTLEYWMNNQYDAIRATSPTRYIDRYGIVLRLGSGEDVSDYKEVVRIYNPDGLLYYWLLQYNGVWYMTYCCGGLFGNNKAQVRFVKIGEITEDGQFKLN